VIDATIDTLMAGAGEDLSIAEVARRAGVHETSIYRRWGSKANLALDAVVSRTQEAIPAPDTGSLRGDLLALLRGFAAFETTPLGSTLLRLAPMRDPPEFASTRASFWADRFALVGDVLDRAAARGELRANVDRSLALEALIGPLHVRLLLTREPLDDAFHEAVVDLVLAGIAAGPQSRAAH
jgi:AcrR family transcriptional regulator